jgi:hypothetical protein
MNVSECIQLVEMVADVYECADLHLPSTPKAIHSSSAKIYSELENPRLLIEIK